MFDNVTAIFSATPVIARTATYIYACAEWIEDAFQGKELLLEIYSRLLNPDVDLAGESDRRSRSRAATADQYFAWNFNSGMAAIDGVLAHVLGRDDVLITSRNIYGGAHQLIHDWYAKSSNLEIGVETFDGYGVAEFIACYDRAKREIRRSLRRRASRRTSISKAPAIRTATCSTCPASAARRTSAGCAWCSMPPSARRFSFGRCKRTDADRAARLRDPQLHEGSLRHRLGHRRRA